MKLVEYTKERRSQGYLVKAIESQSQLAYWSEKVNWKKTVLGGRLDRTELAEMYAKRYAHTKAWSDAAQLGLLLSDVGQRSKAFAVWQKQLTVSAQGPHAQRATGTMLFAYNKIGKWDELEKLAKLAIKKKVSPIHKDSLISPTKMLAEGLITVQRNSMRSLTSIKLHRNLKSLLGYLSRIRDARKQCISWQSPSTKLVSTWLL